MPDPIPDELRDIYVDPVPQWKAEIARLRAALTEIYRYGDSMTGTRLGTPRQERHIWHIMRDVAGSALKDK